jgi:hypothetical protein
MTENVKHVEVLQERLRKVRRLVEEYARVNEDARVLELRHEESATVAAISAIQRESDGAAGGLTTAEREVIETLLSLAYATWNLADSTEDSGEEGLTVQRDDFAVMERLLDKLAELPDDQPGYTMAEAAKARWALRRILSPPQPRRAADE